MSTSPPSGPPYLNWALDRWKLIVLSVLFVILILSALVWLQQPPSGEPRAPAATATPLSAATEVAPATPSPTPQLELPLTLANVAPNMLVEISAFEVLSGTAAANSQVNVRHIYLPEESAAGAQVAFGRAQSLGLSTAGAEGLWRLDLETPLAAGQHLLMAQQLDDSGEVVAETPALVVTAVEAEDSTGIAEPQIQEPAVGQRVSADAMRFRGRGLAGSRAQLFLNERFAGDSMVTSDGNWQIDPSSPLPPGSYVGRAALLDPFGRITAESSSTAFVVQGEGGAMPPEWQAPLVPLQVTAWPPAGEPGAGCAGSLAGVGTPASSVFVLAAGRPLVAHNVQRDTGWRLILPPGLMADCGSLLVSSSLGESVSLAPFYSAVEATADPAGYSPIFVTPQNGETLDTRRPLLRGVARPARPVSVVVNDRLVATVQADLTGQWAYQVTSDLTGDQAVLEAYLAGEDGSVLAASEPVVVKLED